MITETKILFEGILKPLRGKNLRINVGATPIVEGRTLRGTRIVKASQEMGYRVGRFFKAKRSILSDIRRWGNV